MIPITTVQLFVQQFVQADNKEDINACITVPLWGQSAGDWLILISKGQ